MRILHEPAAWGVQADFTAVALHPAALGFTRTWSFVFLRGPSSSLTPLWYLHNMVRSDGFVCPPCLWASMWWTCIYRLVRCSLPRAHEVLCHSQRAQLVRCEPCFIEVDGSGSGVKEPDVEFVAEDFFYCGVDEFGGHHVTLPMSHE